MTLLLSNAIAASLKLAEREPIAMKKYLITVSILIGGEHVEAGEVVSLSKEEGDNLVAIGRAVEATKEAIAQFAAQQKALAAATGAQE